MFCAFRILGVTILIIFGALPATAYENCTKYGAVPGYPSSGFLPCIDRNNARLQAENRQRAARGAPPIRVSEESKRMVEEWRERERRAALERERLAAAEARREERRRRRSERQAQQLLFGILGAAAGSSSSSRSSGGSYGSSYRSQPTLSPQGPSLVTSGGGGGYVGGRGCGGRCQQ
jgi:hypothetical protein